MKDPISPFLGIVGALWIAFSGQAPAQTARLAVAGDSSLANLVDVTTEELSRQPDLTILDRADLDKLGQEQEIQGVLGSRDFSAIRLLPADGLVLLRAVKNGAKTGVFARLIAVQPGVVLREVALPDSPDPMAQARALVKEFAPYWPKLAAIHQGKINALSLLGLRFEVDAPETRDMERSINILLADRLGTEPDTVVLERWRLNDALFEKTLSSQQPTPFWTGSSLIDGSMRWHKENNRVDVTLRLRPPQGPPLSISDQDTPDHLPALVRRLAGRIHDYPSSRITWKPDEEAEHFADLGKWCLDNELTGEGAEALESARALGDDSRTTHMLQIKAYAMQAYPDDLRVFNTMYNPAVIGITRDSLPQRLAAAARAAALTGEYLKANGSFSSPLWDPEDPADLSLPVLNNCLRTLRAAYESDFQRDHGDEVAEARHAVQKLIGQMDSFRRDGPSVYFLIYRVRYAGLWHETPQETLAFYRDLLNRTTDGAKIRDELFSGGLTPPYVDGEGEPALTAPGSVKSPWIVAWDDRPARELEMIWRNFLKELAASPDPVLQADALKFEFCSNRTVAGRDEVLARIVAFLKQHPENICGPRGEDFATGFSTCLDWAGLRPENGACWKDLLGLFVTLFNQHAALPPSWTFATCALANPTMPAESATSLLSALNDYARWYQTQTPQDGQILEALARSRQTIYEMKPELTPTASTPATGALAVHQLWDNRVSLDGGNEVKKQAPLLIDFRTLLVADNKLWFLTHNPDAVVCVDPSSLQIVSSDPIPAPIDAIHSHFQGRHSYLEVTPQWLVVALKGQVLLGSRADGQWHALDLPPSTYKPRWVNQELYLLYDAEYGAALTRLAADETSAVGSGLIRVSLPDGKIENVISSRRIPPQNALDGKSVGQPLDLWMSQSGLTLAFEGAMPHFQVYASPVGTNDWTSIATDLMPCRIEVTPDGALIGHRFNFRTFGQITLMNENGSQVLLANPDLAGVNGPVKSLWKFPDELRSAPPGERSQNNPVMRGGDLCLCHSTLGDAGVTTDGAAACLYYFAKGQKEGTKIPLAFDITKIKGPGSISIVDVKATDRDLIVSTVQNSWQGFWVIPWSEVDAYRAKAIPSIEPQL